MTVYRVYVTARRQATRSISDLTITCSKFRFGTGVFTSIEG